ncbi:hypothetical protein VTJ83DRAFT_2699 [Remersonia thermophila]|uniref:Uncharacterized protein n=1 Tax=Remersonia thermophila TaxID=72144 RepID=A0ABR4DJH1_9PEZI
MRYACKGARSADMAEWASQSFIPALLLLNMAPKIESWFVTIRGGLANPFGGVQLIFELDGTIGNPAKVYPTLKQVHLGLFHDALSPEDSRIVDFLLASAPNAETLELYSSQSTILTKAQVPPRLTSMVLHDIYPDRSAMQQMANLAAATLTKLCIYNDCTGWRVPPLMQQLLIPLRRSRAASTLKVLHIDGAIMDLPVPDIMAGFPSLELLGIRFDWLGRRMDSLRAMLKGCPRLRALLLTAADQITRQEMEGFIADLGSGNFRNPHLRRVVLIPREYRRGYIRPPRRIYWRNLKAAVPWPDDRKVDNAGIEWVLEADNTKKFETIVEECQEALGI